MAAVSCADTQIPETTVATQSLPKVGFRKAIQLEVLVIRIEAKYCQHYVLLTASASARELGFQMPLSDATKGRIPLSPRGEFFLPPLGDWKISLPLLCQELRRGLTLNRYMEPGAADITPAG